MNLTAENVKKVLMDCLFTDEELKACEGKPKEFVEARGIMMGVGLHPQRLESHRADVASMLSELPDEFMEDKGGGMSFLNACMTKNGEQWGEHQNMDELFILGTALKMVQCPMPRQMWSVLPGGMPYYTVNINGFKPKAETQPA